MPKQLNTKIEFLKKLKPDIYLLAFESAYIAQTVRPGQFVHIKIDNKATILRRPFSIHKVNGNTIYILFRMRGRGTKILSQYKPGDTLDIIGPLGNGFNYVQRSTFNVQHILVAGGMGVAPLVFLAGKLNEIRNHKSETRNLVLLGAKNKNEVLAEQEFRRLGFDVRVATDDGSRGFKGTIIELLAKVLSAHKPMSSSAHMYACGPKEMFCEIAKIIKRHREINCQVSFEQFMGCGLGICYGCTIETKQGYKKVCKDGPVFDIKDIK
ncbi:MAG: dihydroorotate dehydrogenase electron transfer subunit [Candidatus Omnitrophota bacterium]|nr:dihydroorotate dehydrogenase electron transfer subunit [Candidatus Omnitrophota bacterium]